MQVYQKQNVRIFKFLDSLLINLKTKEEEEKYIWISFFNLRVCTAKD